MKCPFCQQELCQDYTGVMYCCNEDCEQSADWYGSPILWQALIHTKKQLDRAKWWLKEIMENHRYTPISTAEMALKELEDGK